LYANTILKPKQVIWLEKLSFGVYILAIFPTGNMASRWFTRFCLWFFLLKLKNVRRTSNSWRLCKWVINAAHYVQYIANAPLINNPARKLCAIKLRVSAINVFQQPLKCDNEEIDCDVAEIDQKTKLILHVTFQSIILLSQFCSLYAKRSILRVNNVSVVIAWLLQHINFTECT
jgi:hypothetical protein